MDCVKCGAELTGSEVECPSCGVIPSKARTSPPTRRSTAEESEPVATAGIHEYHYLVAPFHDQLRAGQDVTKVSAQLRDLINHYAAYGWEFVQIGSVSLTINNGCLAALFGYGSSQHSYDQVVFRRRIENGPEGSES